MKTLSKAVAVASLLTAGVMSAQVANAEVSYNAAAVSDYVWRGFTQADKDPAMQGGADYAHESGLSAGAWGSTLFLDGDDGQSSYELDLYASYGFKAADMDLSVGFIAYTYEESDSDFEEVNFGLAKGDFSGLVSVLLDAEEDAGYTYLEGAYDVALPQDLGLSLHAGYILQENDDTVDNWFDMSATVGKSLEMLDVAATLSYNGQEDNDDDVLFFLTASKEF